jgi:hypothetical protein
VGNTPEDDEALTEAATCMGLDISNSLPDKLKETQCEVWPEHWDALRLFLACRSQLELSVGAMGGLIYSAARSTNIQQELHWLDLPRKLHAPTVILYRVIESEAVNQMNERANRKP